MYFFTSKTLLKFHQISLLESTQPKDENLWYHAKLKTFYIRLKSSMSSLLVVYRCQSLLSKRAWIQFLSGALMAVWLNPLENTDFYRVHALTVFAMWVVGKFSLTFESRHCKKGNYCCLWFSRCTSLQIMMNWIVSTIARLDCIGLCCT